MAQQPDSYPFISTVEGYLAEVRDDCAMRSLAVKSLVDKGLLSIALEVGQACPPATPQAVQLLAAVERLASVQKEIVPWSRTDRRFEANLGALRSRGPSGQDLAGRIVEAWNRVANDFTLHQTSDGNVLVRGSRSDGRRIWIPAALDFAGKVETVGDGKSLKGVCIPPFLIDGVGMGWWLPRLYEITRNTYLNYSCAIYIVETNLRALALVLRLQDWSAPLADERVYLFAGPSAWEQWRDALRVDGSLPLPKEPTLTIRWPGQIPSPAKERLSEVAEYRRATLAELRSRAEAIYAERDVAWWAGRYATAGPDNPLRVLCVTSRFTTFLKYSMRDIASALERAGMATRLLMEPKDHAGLPAHLYMETFIGFQPDLVLLIDHHRHEQPQAYINNVPFACWIQDPLPNLMSRRAGQSVGPLDFVFGYYRPRCLKEFGYPPDRFFYAPIPVAHAMFSEAPVDEAEARCLACDVMYVGHLNQTIDSLRAQWRSEQPREIHPILDRIDAFIDGVRERGEHLQEHCSPSDPTPLIRRLAGDMGDRLAPESAERLFSFYAYRAFDIGFRLQTLHWVAEWANRTGRVFKLYGNGWKDLTEFAPFAMGPIEHGEEMRKAYRCAKLAIQTMPSTFQHQRSLEAIASGCLVLCRHIAGDFGGLELDEVRRRRQAGEPLPDAAGRFRRLEEVAFRNAEEMALVAQRFLEDPERYRHVLADFREDVLRAFSYDRVMAGVIEQIGDALHRQAHARKSP